MKDKTSQYKVVGKLKGSIHKSIWWILRMKLTINIWAL